MLRPLPRAANRVILACVLTMCVLVGCSEPPPAPDVTMLRWVQAFAAQDGTTVAGLTCRASQSDAQNTRLVTIALGISPPNFGGGGGGGGGGQLFFGGGGGGQLVYDVSNLQYETTFADARSARVSVTGLLRMSSGMNSQVLSVNTTPGLIREQEQWRVCDAPPT